MPSTADQDSTPPEPLGAGGQTDSGTAALLQRARDLRRENEQLRARSRSLLQNLVASNMEGAASRTAMEDENKGRRRSEAALHLSQEKYRTVLNSMEEGFFIGEILFNEAGEAIDCRFLEANDSFYTQTGLEKNVVGKTIRDLAPQTTIPWVELHRKVVAARRTERFEHQSTALPRAGFYDVQVMPLSDSGGQHVAVLFRNITARKRREAQTAFLADIMADFAALSREDDILKLTCRRVAAHFGVARCVFAEFDSVLKTDRVLCDSTQEGSQDGGKHHHLGDCHTPEEIRALAGGHPVQVADARASSRGGMRALASAPYVSDGQWKFVLSVLQPKPRAWHADEVETLQELSARVWLRLERARSEEALRASEERNRIALEASQMAAWDFDVRANHILWNDQHYRLFGLTPDGEAKTVQHFLDFVHPDDRPRVAEELRAAVEQAGVYRSEFRVVRTDGIMRWMFGFGQAVEMKEGRSMRMSGIMFDITERREAEEELAAVARLSTFRLRLTDSLRTLSDPVEVQHRVFELLGPYLGANRVLYAEIGDDQDHVEVTENYVKDAPKIIGTLRLRDFGKTLKRKLRAGLTVAVAQVADAADLSARDRTAYAQIGVAAHVAVPLLKDRKLTGVFAVHQSLPRAWTAPEIALIEEVAERTRSALDRTRAERALRKSEEQLRLIVENARDYAIISADLQRRITRWNSGAEQIFGYRAEEVLGESLDLIFIPEDRLAGLCEQEAQTALDTGTASDERWHLRKNGTSFWVSGVLMAMRDADGAAVGFVKILRDHTEARRAAEALAKSHAEAEAANKAKDHFLAVLSHELRTPLTPVLLVAGDMAANPKLPASSREAMRMVHRNVELEARLIDDLLDVTRITRGKMDLVFASTDLHEVIARAVEITAQDLQEKKQRLTLHLEAAEHWLSGDAKRLQQVFWNLLKNASKFTPSGGEIKIESRNEDGVIQVKVSDSGIGIRPEMLGKIFNPFEQGEADRSREFGGLGLGLAIAKATVDAHQGQIGAQSDGAGSGAIFTVRLPLAVEGK